MVVSFRSMTPRGGAELPPRSPYDVTSGSGGTRRLDLPNGATDARRNLNSVSNFALSTPDPARAQCEPTVLPGATPAGVAGEVRADCGDPPASSSRFTSP